MKKYIIFLLIIIITSVILDNNFYVDVLNIDGYPVLLDVDGLEYYFLISLMAIYFFLLSIIDSLWSVLFKVSYSKFWGDSKNEADREKKGLTVFAIKFTLAIFLSLFTCGIVFSFYFTF